MSSFSWPNSRPKWSAKIKPFYTHTQTEDEKKNVGILLGLYMHVCK